MFTAVATGCPSVFILPTVTVVASLDDGAELPDTKWVILIGGC